MSQVLEAKLGHLVDMLYQNNTGLIFTACFLFCITYYNVSSKKKLTLLNGEGISVTEYLCLCIFSYIIYPQNSQMLFIILISMIHAWLFPLKELSAAFLKASHSLQSLYDIRAQVPKVAPYASELLPYTPQLFKKRRIVLENVVLLGDAMPKMMEHKQYILPVMDDIIDKLEILIPTIPSLLPILDKVAPSIPKILPRIELLAPYIDDLLPLWDEISPHLDTMLLEMDNLAPVLPLMAKDMEKLIPILNLMPLAHESGVLEYDVIKKSLPFMTKLLPGTQDVVLRYFVTNASQVVEDVANRGKTLLSRKNVKPESLLVVNQTEIEENKTILLA